MKFEIVIALILGVTLGIAGMISIVFISKNVKQAKIEQTAAAKPTAIPSSKEFKIIKPASNISHNNKDILISGETTDNYAVIISSNTSDFWVKSSENKFEKLVTPIVGTNTIDVINSINLKKLSVDVLSADSIPNDKTYTEGVITDITAEYLQIRENNGSIGQVGINSKTTAITITKDLKNISISDIAIGDFIYAILEAPDKPTATNIIVYNGQKIDSSHQIIKGTLESFGKGTLKLTSDEKNSDVNYSSKTKLVGINEDDTTRTRTKLINSDLDSTIFAIISGTDSAAIARTIFIRPPKN